jgi:hypothetical protein
MGIASNLPVLNSVVSVFELWDGVSLRPGQGFGQPLDGWGYADRVVGMALDAVIVGRVGYSMTRPRPQTPAAPNSPTAAPTSSAPTGPAHNAANYARLREFYRQAEQYGQGGYRVLENGRYRFYGELKPARTAGEMQGARLVREWDPVTGNTRTWYETLDHLGRVRSVAPKPPTGPLNHRIFDADGNYQGLR